MAHAPVAAVVVPSGEHRRGKQRVAGLCGRAIVPTAATPTGLSPSGGALRMTAPHAHGAPLGLSDVSFARAMKVIVE